jgi:alpha-glucosidase (family GH31 glycosyl hydrolase)
MKVTATGGMGDVFIMLAEGPNEVVQLYQTVVGKPVLTPQWALGWNQCKWGYTNIKELQDVVDTYRTLGLPLDTQWSDIDYLDRYRDFTFDPVNFAGLGEFVEDLHKHGQHYIPILDAGVAKRPEDGY